MDERPITNNLEVLSFLRGTVPEACVPSERDDDRPAVNKVNGKGVVLNGDPLSPRLFNLHGRSSHAKYGRHLQSNHCP